MHFLQLEQFRRRDRVLMLRQLLHFLRRVRQRGIDVSLRHALALHFCAFSPIWGRLYSAALSSTTFLLLHLWLLLLLLVLEFEAYLAAARLFHFVYLLINGAPAIGID